MYVEKNIFSILAEGNIEGQQTSQVCSFQNCVYVPSMKFLSVACENRRNNYSNTEMFLIETDSVK